MSKKSALMFIYINIPLVSVAYLYSYLLCSAAPAFIYLTLFTALRNLVLVEILKNGTRLKDVIHSGQQSPEGYFLPAILQASAIEAAAIPFVPLTMTMNPYVWLTFIPMSFMFEVVFDFFHYWVHRSLHYSALPWHKAHHTYVHLTPAIAFYQDWADLILANVIPFFLANRIVQTVWGPLTAMELSLLLTYKIFVELSGHAGRRLRPSSSFPQCVWLPRALGIELYAEDHALHHTNPGCNFAKRFALWDKVFGTYHATV